VAIACDVVTKSSEATEHNAKLSFTGAERVGQIKHEFCVHLGTRIFKAT
jgi:hypothetical protein